jgi:hypothetical protein
MLLTLFETIVYLSCANRLRAGRSGIRIPAGARDFSRLQNVPTSSGAIQPPTEYRAVTALSVIWLRREANHLPTPNAEVQNEGSYIFFPLYAFMACKENTSSFKFDVSSFSDFSACYNTKCTVVCACFPRIQAQKALDAEVAIREGMNSSCTKIYLLFPLRRPYRPNTKNLKTNVTVDQKSMQHALGSSIWRHAPRWWEGVETFVTICDERGRVGGFKYHDVTKVLI